MAGNHAQFLHLTNHVSPFLRHDAGTRHYALGNGAHSFATLIMGGGGSMAKYQHGGNNQRHGSAAIMAGEKRRRSGGQRNAGGVSGAKMAIA